MLGHGDISPVLSPPSPESLAEFPGSGWCSPYRRRTLTFSAAGSLPSAVWVLVQSLVHLSGPSRALVGGYVLVWLVSLALVAIGGVLVLGAVLLPP